MTGEGWADAIVVNDNTVTVRRAAADCFIWCWNFRFDPNEDWTSGPYFGTTLNAFADVDGDGRADAIVINGGQGAPFIRRSDGSRFQGNQLWSSSFVPGTKGSFLFDLNFDHRRTSSPSTTARSWSACQRGMVSHLPRIGSALPGRRVACLI